MSKSVELLAESEDSERIPVDNTAEERSRLNLNGSRQLSKSATELRDNDIEKLSPSRRGEVGGESGVIHHHRHHRHATSVAQRTHTFFATLKSRWARSRSKERKKSKDGGGGGVGVTQTQDATTTYKTPGIESDYAADYSSEHSRSSSATQSPARHCLKHPESPLARAGRERILTMQEDSPGKCSDASSKGSLNRQSFKDVHTSDDPHASSISNQDGAYVQDETVRRRELALRQHAFFQLRLHIRRGANLVAMDRCGASDPYVKIKSSGRLLHKSRTVHRDLNPVWDESVTLPIEDPFQPLTIKVEQLENQSIDLLICLSCCFFSTSKRPSTFRQVFDYDWGLQDDFMGAAQLDLTQFDLGFPQDVSLELKDPARPKQHLGEVFLTGTLWPRNQQEKEQEHCKLEPPLMGTSKDDNNCTVKHEEASIAVDQSMAVGPSSSSIKNPTIDQEKKFERQKERMTIGSLKNSIDKKLCSVEKKLEDRVEKIWEDNVEKHPWLIPIENWIIDRCKSDTTDKSQSKKIQDHCHRLKDTTYEFKFIAAEGADEEPKIESVLKERPKRGIRKLASTKLKRSSIDEQTIISHFKSMDKSFRSHSAEDVSVIGNRSTDSEEILTLKEVKPNNPLLDRFVVNVKEKMEDIHRYFQRTNRLADVNRKLKSQIWSSVVTIVLVEAKSLLPMDIDGLSDPYVKFRLGTEKYKSKVINKTLNPVWLEQFDLHLYEDPYLGQELEVTVWDRDRSHQDDLMGRTVINLATLERETTHRLWRDLEDGSGNIFLLLTISGTTASETISDLAAHEETPKERSNIIQRYSLANTLQRPRDVGHLTVKIYRAQGLVAADLGGKSDPFCVLELVNARLQTQTEYKTLAPNWQKIFTFNVKDINSVLEVTVYDEDRDHKVEFLGKVAIPLLRIRNGEKRWYALKDKKLRGRAKGNSPQILLEMTVIWNVFRACIRTLNPKEKKYMEPEIKFKRQIFFFLSTVRSCWEWESKPRSIFALIIFVLGCYYFEPYMIPALALLILLKYYLVAAVTGASLTHQTSPHFQDTSELASDDGPVTPGDDDDDEDDKDKEEKKSLKERLQAIQEVTQTVQNSIGYIASLCERIKNLFNFTVPYLSYLAMTLTIIGAAVLYCIPVRYLILAWGVNKFSRKIFRPHTVPNNEVLDLISRVPDDEEILNYRELKPLPTADCERGGVPGFSGGNTAKREQRKRHKVA
ncbi:hypothetical protein M0802_000645 [Mischocyttarus mexicanus]|nr:hypothetical protein M0802_000645 [Mischocyttarus mexicanus]